MAASPPNDHFNQLSTSWTLLAQAHDPAAPTGQRAGARQQLLERYGNLARRYLAGALRGVQSREEAVHDCFQEFGVRVMDGRLQGADPGRGRFRDYLRVCLGHLVADYHRSRQRRPEGLGDRESQVSDPPPEDERRYQQVWREDLLARALQALEAHEQSTGQRLYSVLKLKMDHPE